MPVMTVFEEIYFRVCDKSHQAMSDVHQSSVCYENEKRAVRPCSSKFHSAAAAVELDQYTIEVPKVIIFDNAVEVERLRLQLVNEVEYCCICSLAFHVYTLRYACLQVLDVPVEKHVEKTVERSKHFLMSQYIVEAINDTNNIVYVLTERHVPSVRALKLLDNNKSFYCDLLNNWVQSTEEKRKKKTKLQEEHISINDIFKAVSALHRNTKNQDANQNSSSFKGLNQGSEIVITRNRDIHNQSPITLCFTVLDNLILLNKALEEQLGNNNEGKKSNISVYMPTYSPANDGSIQDTETDQFVENEDEEGSESKSDDAINAYNYFCAAKIVENIKGDNEHLETSDLSLWDFAGQNVYYATHQVFLSRRAVYLLVMDISEHIDDPWLTDCRGEAKCRSAEYIDFWLNSKHEYCSYEGKSGPPIILVGTFADQLKEDISPDDAWSSLREILVDKAASCHLTTENCLIDNSVEDENIQSLKKHIIYKASKPAYWGEDIEAMWVTFEDVLIRIKEENLKEQSCKNTDKDKEDEETYKRYKVFHLQESSACMTCMTDQMCCKTDLSKAFNFKKTTDCSTDISVWDFGGQHIFYSTHQMFLSLGAGFYPVIRDHEEKHIKDLSLLLLVSNNVLPDAILLEVILAQGQRPWKEKWPQLERKTMPMILIMLAAAFGRSTYNFMQNEEKETKCSMYKYISAVSNTRLCFHAIGSTSAGKTSLFLTLNRLDVLTELYKMPLQTESAKKVLLTESDFRLFQFMTSEDSDLALVTPVRTFLYELKQIKLHLEMMESRVVNICNPFKISQSEILIKLSPFNLNKQSLEVDQIDTLIFNENMPLIRISQGEDSEKSGTKRKSFFQKVIVKRKRIFGITEKKFSEISLLRQKKITTVAKFLLELFTLLRGKDYKEINLNEYIVTDEYKEGTTKEDLTELELCQHETSKSLHNDITVHEVGTTRSAKMSPIKDMKINQMSRKKRKPFGGDEHIITLTGMDEVVCEIPEVTFKRPGNSLPFNDVVESQELSKLDSLEHKNTSGVENMTALDRGNEMKAKLKYRHIRMEVYPDRQANQSSTSSVNETTDDENDGEFQDLKYKVVCGSNVPKADGKCDESTFKRLTKSLASESHENDLLEVLRSVTWLTSEEMPSPRIDQVFLETSVYFVTEFEPLMVIINLIADGNPPTPHVSMRYELLRFCTLRSYPKENKPYLIKLAEAGFYYASDGDGVVCYCCGVRRYNWVAEDNPMKIHQRINPNCKFLRKNDEVNVPVQYFGPFSRALMAIMDIPEPRERPEQSEDVNNDWAPERAPERSPAPAQQNRTNEAASNSLGISTAIPKHTQYATKTAREGSYSGWPDTASHTPQELAEAGFFYAGFGDCVRCFYCGIGLRHWTKDDNPWIEHARWSRNCVFVKQKKGEEFVNLVQLAVQYSQDNEAQSNSSAGNQLPAQEVERILLSDAAQSVLEMGYQPRIIKKAIEQILRQNGNSKITAQFLMEKVLEIEEAENPPQATAAPAQAHAPPEAAAAQPPAKPPPQTTKPEAAKAPEGATVQSNTEKTKDQDKKGKASIENKDKKEGNTNSVPKEDEAASQDPKAIKAENEQLKEQTLCKVCLDNTVCIVFLPCGHLVTCADCAPAMRKCPICRALVKGTVRTYMS